MKNLLITFKFVFISILCFAQSKNVSGVKDTFDPISYFNGVVDEELTFNEVSVYPNPTKGDFTIDLGDYYETVTIQIMDALGHVITSENYSVGQYLHLNLDVPKGIYFLNILSAEKRKIVRMVKE